RGDLASADPAPGLLVHPVPQVRVLVAEGWIPGELSVRRWRESVTVADPVHIVHGKPPALEESGYQQHAINTAECRRQRVGLGREIAAQGRVAAAGNDEATPGLAGRLVQVGGDLLVDSRRFRLRQAARVG